MRTVVGANPPDFSDRQDFALNPIIGVNMAIDVTTLNKKQLRDLIRKANGRMKNIDKEKIGKVAPKYRNPAGSETWSGRGKRPRWFLAALKAGKKEKDLLIK